MNQEKCGIKTDVKQLLRLLGPSMYKGNVLEVAVKELLQNSFDAVKKSDTGRVDITTDSYDNVITCVDNGVGMTADTVRNVYLTIGGTLKEMDVTERSGGLGLAKVQFFLSASRIVVNTVRNGEHTILDCSQEELLTGEAHLIVEPTYEPNGTTVKLYYPREVHQLDGSVTSISMPWRFNILEHPLLGYPNVSVTHNQRTCCTVPSKYTHSFNLEFPWGYAEILYSPDSYDPNSTWGVSTEVYSAGLYQFKKDFRKDVIGYLKFNAMINIRPKVAAGMAGYPFNNTREGFNVSVQKDVDTISKYLFDIQSVLHSERIRRQFESLTSLQYVTVDGKAYEKTVAPGTNDVKYSAEFLMRLLEAFRDCSSVYEKKDIVEEAETKVAASKEEIEKLYSDSLKLNNRTTGTYSCFDLFSKVSSILLDLINQLPAKYDGKRRPAIAGVILQKQMYGCLTSGSVNGIWINPLISGGNPNVWVYDMMNTIIHEIAHIRQEYHGESHNNEMMDVAHWLIGEGLYTQIEGKLFAVYNDNREELLEASRVFANSQNI